MSTQQGVGTPISVNATVPVSPTDAPLIILTIGDTGFTLRPHEAIRLASNIKHNARTTADPEKAQVTVDGKTWVISKAGAIRLADALVVRSRETGSTG